MFWPVFVTLQLFEDLRSLAIFEAKSSHSLVI